MKIFLLVLILFLIPSALAGNVTRDFSVDSLNVGEVVTVSLVIEVADAEMVYAVQENLPNGSAFRWLQYESGELNSTTETYAITFDYVGTYNFSGTYAFNDVAEAEILGDFQINVVGPAPDVGGDNGGGGGGGGGGSAPVVCIENWTCVDWGVCTDSLKTRTCADSNNCNTTESKPAVSLSCVTGEEGEEETPQADDIENNSKSLIYLLGGVLILFIVVIIIVIKKVRS